MVIILRGTSGSGKSRLSKLLLSSDFHTSLGLLGDSLMTPATAFAEQLWNSYGKKEGNRHHLSADNMMMTVGGEYKFDIKLLPAAHSTCLRDFIEAIKDPNAVIVLDNTNCTLLEVVPYAQIAKAYVHELNVITLLVPSDVSWKRNQHGTPYSKVVQQSLKLQESIHEWPSWIPQVIYPE